MCACVYAGTSVGRFSFIQQALSLENEDTRMISLALHTLCLLLKRPECVCQFSIPVSYSVKEKNLFIFKKYIPESGKF
jgi:hypothetical protein